MNCRDVLLTFVIVLIFFFSGEMRIYNLILGEKMSVIMMFICCFIYNYISNKSFKLSHFNEYALSIIIGWILFASYILNHESSGKTIVICMNIASICFLVSSTSFNIFRNKMLKVASIISLLSIVVQIGHDIGLFPAYQVNFDVANSPRSLYIFTTEWGEGTRLASIYWEPGQYQIILSYVICLFADELSDVKNFDKIIKKFGIIILAFILTRSTMGYVVFTLILVTIFSNFIFNKRNFFLSPFIVLLGFFIIYTIYNSEAIQQKLEQSDNIKAHSSFSVRLADNLALLNCIEEKPITGWGPESPHLKSSLYSFGSTTDSNGVLLASAELGLIYTAIWTVLLFLGLNRMYGWKITIGLTISLLLAQMNEVGYFLPIVYIYLFKFKSYNSSKKIQLKTIIKIYLNCKNQKKMPHPYLIENI